MLLIYVCKVKQFISIYQIIYVNKIKNHNYLSQAVMVLKNN
nr:MAG TPA: hypothetical protein [Ackermannviridae sp.]